jgi:serine/threonine-protein kinase PknG
VLKGLLNTADEAAAAAAVAERQFLAAVKHPNIVGIYNFVSRGTEGFIVMEFVAGTSVKDVRKKRGALPPAEAIAYVHRILAAFAYLHRQGMVYCDFKPDNFMLEGDPADVKLIDMGGVRRLDDPYGDIYGTRGYSAPEAGEGPTVASDLFTIGRTLAVLLMDFSYQGRFEFTLPQAHEQPVLAKHESLYRFLQRATAQDPDRRFQSADEMADQLGGVLREVVAGSVPPRPVESTLFGGDVLALLDTEDGTGLHAPSVALMPELKADPEDKATSHLQWVMAVSDPAKRAAMLEQSQAKYPDSRELSLRLAQTLILAGRYEKAETVLAAVETKDPFEWRVVWYRGVSLLCQGKAKEARAAFDQVYGELPGELAVKLAVALAAESAGDSGTAIRLYDLVSRTDPGFSSAAFGLARCLAKAGKRSEAAEAYGRVPATSILYVQAQTALARTWIRPAPTPPGAEEVQKAAAVIEALALEGMEQARLRAEVLETTLEMLDKRTMQADRNTKLLGEPLQATALRRALEQALRQMARLESDRAKQIELVDRANAVRPWTWV